MNIGMLWFDNDPKTDLSEKIKAASAYYLNKYGEAPNQCVVNPVMLPDNKLKSFGLKITASQTILPNHLWIGFNAAIKQVGKSS